MQVKNDNAYMHTLTILAAAIAKWMALAGLTKETTQIAFVIFYL